MPALENAVLDSTSELVVTNDSDYNWIILIYKVTRYTDIYNIYKFQAEVLKSYLNFLDILDILKKYFPPFKCSVKTQMYILYVYFYF